MTNQEGGYTHVIETRDLDHMITCVLTLLYSHHTAKEQNKTTKTSKTNIAAGKLQSEYHHNLPIPRIHGPDADQGM